MAIKHVLRVRYFLCALLVASTKGKNIVTQLTAVDTEQNICSAVFQSDNEWVATRQQSERKAL